MKPIPDYVKILIVVLTAISAVYGTYNWGYSSAETKYEAIFKKQNEKKAELKNREVIIEKEVVVKYVDRIKTVTEVQTKIIEVTRDVLQEESTRCDIGPNFIWLHDSSASNQDISTTSSGVDGSSDKADPSQPKITLIDVSETITKNYEICHKISEQLISLQEWTKKVREESINVNGRIEDNKEEVR